MPSLLLATVTLVTSLCCCYYIHSGNRELHRELKQYNRKQDVIDKYLVGDQESGIQVAKEDKMKQSKPTPEIVIDDEGSSDDDSGLFEMADLSRAETIESAGVIDETRTPSIKGAQSNLMKSPSMLSVRSLERGKQNLHPLNGLVQPTGLVPQGGYQANMRLLFNQRPASAVSHGAASNHFLMKSRPASAISRFSTASRPTTAFANGAYDESSEDEVFSDLDDKNDKLNSSVQVSKQRITSPQEDIIHGFKKSANGPFKNGPVKNGLIKKGPVKNAIIKGEHQKLKVIKDTVDKTSRRAESTKSVSVSAKPSNGSIPLTKAGRGSLSSASSGSSRPSSCSTETVMERIIRFYIF